MSSILKALRKLEEQKKGRRESPIDLERHILQGSPASRSQMVVLVSAAMVVGGIGAALVTFVAMGGLAQRGEEQAAGATPPAMAVQKELTATMPAREERMLPSVQEGHPKAALPSRQAERAAAEPSPPATPATAMAVEIPSPPTRGNSPALVVSGIAYQHENAARMAVVNGQTVTEGVTVAGARVEEILPDRVRFSQQGVMLEVMVGKVTP